MTSSEEERVRVINVVKELYNSKFMWKMAETHSKCWAQWHKTSEGIGHRWLTHEIEKEMQAIDPGVTIPYWVNNFESWL